MVIREPEVLAFFRGTGEDVECRTLDQIIAWQDVLMEVCHDYIQWLFPTDEASKFNPDAPILDEEVQSVFKTDKAIRLNFQRGLARFMSFLGLSLEIPEPDAASELGKPRVARAGNFEQRLRMCWQGPANHNWRRVSRVLRCLALIGMEDHQHAFFKCLEEIIADYPGMVDETSIAHWRCQVTCPIDRGYASALLGSKALLHSFAAHYLKRYDKNADGILQLDEALLLVRELHEGLGVRAEFLDEEMLRDSVQEEMLRGSVQEFSQGKALDATEFPGWFAKVLQSTIDKDRLKTKVLAADEHEAGNAVRPTTAPSPFFERQLSPGYAKSLLDSPQLLNGLCKQYFKRYDVNVNGILELGEAIKLSRELQTSLGMPSETLDEWQLLSSIKRFGKEGDGKALTQDEFPGWFAEALRSSLSKIADREARRRYTTF